MAQYFSNKSRIHTGTKDINYTNKEDEWLYQYCKTMRAKAPIDYFIFGHRHLPMEIAVSESRYLNLGEWINFSTYGEFDGSTMALKVWSEDGEKAFEGIKE